SLLVERKACKITYASVSVLQITSVTGQCNSPIKLTVLDSILLEYNLDLYSIVVRTQIYPEDATFAFTRAAYAFVSSPSLGNRYPGRVGSTSGSTPTEFTGQSMPSKAAISDATSAWSTSRRNKCSKFH